MLRAGLALTAAAAVGSYALEIRLARGYVLVALPLATAGLPGRRASCCGSCCTGPATRGACLRRVVVVGHELAVSALTRQLRRERYHGLEVVGACLPPAATGRAWRDLPVYGTFDDVAGAVRAGQRPTPSRAVAARSWTGTRCAGSPGSWSATTST